MYILHIYMANLVDLRPVLAGAQHGFSYVSGAFKAVGLLWTPVSVYQMLQSSIIIFSAVIRFCWMGKGAHSVLYSDTCMCACKPRLMVTCIYAYTSARMCIHIMYICIKCNTHMLCNNYMTFWSDTRYKHYLPIIFCHLYHVHIWEVDETRFVYTQNLQS